MVNVFNVKDPTPRSRSNGEKNGTHGKILSQGILLGNIKALALTVQTLLARLKFQRGGQNDRIIEWQTGQKQYPPPPDLRSRGHKNTRHVYLLGKNINKPLVHFY